MIYYFISPHLDDAIFSAGCLISQISRSNTVKIITVFTRPVINSNTLFTLRYIRKSGFKDSITLFLKRKQEDLRVLHSLGIEPIHLDFIDVGWRKKRKTNSFLGFIPELNHLYPTRFHILNGRIQNEDKVMMKEISSMLKKNVNNSKSVIFCPLGVGKQVDHIIVRNICQQNFSKVVYWEDYPYILKNNPDQQFINQHMLNKILFRSKIDKKNLILGYNSQVEAYFKNKEIKIIPEQYYSNYKSILNSIKLLNKTI